MKLAGEIVLVKKRNLGIDLLKVAACFMVVDSHYGVPGGEILALPVPVFIFLSLFMAYGKLNEPGVLAKRLERLLVPFAAWGITYFIADALFCREFNIEKLLWQLTFGHSVCKPLFFLPLLCLYTAFVWMLAKRLDRWLIYAVAMLVVASLAMQYSGLNYAIFSPLPEEMSWPCGRILECLPPAMIACVASRAMSKIDGRRTKIIAVVGFLAFSAYVVSQYTCPMPRCPGFNKQGLGLLIGTVSLSMFAISFGRLLPHADGRNLISRLADLTFGIYLVHVLVAHAFEFAFGKWKSYTEAVAIFAISAAIVFILQKFRYTRKFVI